MSKARTLYEKIWDSHVVAALDEEERLLYVDRHLVYEVTSPQAFEGLRAAGRKVRRPDLTLAVADHNVPTEGRALGLASIEDPEERRTRFQEMVDRMYAHGKAVSMASHFEIDDVIDPADSRAWISAGLRSVPPPPPRTAKKRPCVDAW